MRIHKYAKYLLILIFLSILMVAGRQHTAAQVYQPGFRTIGIWSSEPRIRLDLNIWYPALRQPKDLSFPPWTIQAALNAKAAEGAFPLLVLSHATPADRFSYHQICAFLAREGFIVAAPTHPRDCMRNMDTLFTLEQLQTRASDIAATINQLLSDKTAGISIDPARIGMIGFGSGATAALLLGGAMPDCSFWPEYKRRAPKHDPYLTPWAEDRISRLCAALPLANSLADPRIKAIAAIAPGFGMLFDKESFRHFHPPLLLVSAGRDLFNPPLLHFAHLAPLLGSKAKILDFPLADSGDFASADPAEMKNGLRDGADRGNDEDCSVNMQKLADALLAFFRHYLVITDNIPVIPQPGQ